MTAWIYAESQLWSRIAAWFAGIKSEFVLNFITKNRWRMLLNGLGTTLLITLFSCLMGIAIGVVVSIVRSTWDKAGADMRPGFSRGLLRVLNRIAVIYLTVIRGTPVVIQLMIAYYVIFASSRNGVRPVRKRGTGEKRLDDGFRNNRRRARTRRRTQPRTDGGGHGAFEK